MIELRPYQRASIDALYEHWNNGGGHALIDLATGCGKSIVIATVCKEILQRWPHLRILCLVHTRELVAQNAQEMMRLWPQAPIGVNSASLGRRDTRSQILFASVQSVYQHGEKIGPRDLIIGDECHLWPKAGFGMYRTLLADLLKQSPDLRILGTSATCFRMDSGHLAKGKDALFEKVVYSYGIADGVADGFLSPLVSKATHTRIDASGVKVQGGEFVARELEKISMLNVREAVEEMVEFGRDRRAWLAFCAGVDHAHEVCKAVRAHGITCETVTGETPTGERDRIIRAYKAGQIRCLTNVQVLTTGFNVPHVDMLAFMRATLSPGLYVQMAGRGTRLAEGKENCLILDYAGVVARHGPVDAINIRDRSSGDIEKIKPEDIRAKECPECASLIAIQCRTCPDCGYSYPAPEKPKHEARADSHAVVMASITPPKWLTVNGVTYSRHTKPGRPDSLRVSYRCGLQSYDEWVALESEKARGMASAWWRKMAGHMSPTPRTVDEALERLGDLVRPTEIMVRPEGKYWRIVAHRVPSRVEVAA